MTLVEPDLAQRIAADVATLAARAATAEYEVQAARHELRLILDTLPYAEAKTGKNAKLRKRLQRFLGERLAGL